jgi:hypothetical protein
MLYLSSGNTPKLTAVWSKFDVQYTPLYHEIEIEIEIDHHAITNLEADAADDDAAAAADDDDDDDDGKIPYETISRNTIDSKISSDHALSKQTSTHDIPTSMPALYFPVIVSPDIDGCEVLVVLGEKNEQSLVFDTSIIVIRQSEYTKSGQLYELGLGLGNKVSSTDVNVNLSWADIHSWVVMSPVKACFSSCFQRESTNLSDELASASASLALEDLNQNYIVIFSIIYMFDIIYILLPIN